MSGGAAKSVLPIAGAVVGGVAGGPAGAMAGYSVGSGLSGAMNNGSSGGSNQALLGSPQQQTVGAQSSGSDDGNPFAAYGTNQLPQNIQQMSLPEGTGKEAPGSADKAAGYATTAMQAINAAQAAQQEREANDAAIWKMRNPLAGVVVQGPGMGNVSTQMGQFPTVGQGFGRY